MDRSSYQEGFRMAVRRCRLSVAFALAFFCGHPFAQNNNDHANWGGLSVNWKTDCAARGCLMHTDVLRGDSGSPANPKDFREYIGVDVALERETRQTAYIAFEVDPRATPGRGIFIEFVKTMRSGKSWKVSLDEDGTMEIPISRCKKWSCEARIPGGDFEVKPSTGKRINLLEKFLTSDAVMVLYTKSNRAYRTMILLSSFQKEYKQVMAVDLAPAQVQHAP
jgi:hypothetical protein